MRAAHGAEVRLFSAVLRQRFVMEFLGFFWIEAQVKLVVPTEFKTRFG